MTQILWMARHGNRLDFVYPEWFLMAKRRYDPPLSEDGLKQAKKLAARLQSENIDQIFSSPFLRTIQTANEVAEMLNLPIKLEAGLSEWLNPDWMRERPEIHTQQELALKYPRIDCSYQSFIIPQYPENEARLNLRTGETAKLLLEEYSENILLVGHSMSVLGATRRLIGEDVAVNTPLCSLVKLVNLEGRWEMELNGDISHLEE